MVADGVVADPDYQERDVEALESVSAQTVYKRERSRGRSHSDAMDSAMKHDWKIKGNGRNF